MINKKIASEIAVGVVLLIAIVVGGIFWMQNEKTENIEQPSLPTGQPPGKAPIEKNVRMCTQDAKLCSDGSYVSRTGPKCEFAACPVVDKDSDVAVSIKKDNDRQFSIDNIEFSLPEELMVEYIKDNIIYIKDLNYKTEYNVFLVLDRIRKFPLVGSEYESEEERFNNTSIKGGVVFQIRAGGAFMVAGMVTGESVYQLDWAVNSNQPTPENLDGPWLPDSSFTQENVMNIMKGASIK